MDIDDDSNSVFKRREPFTFMMYLAIFGSSLLFLFILFVFLKKEFAVYQLSKKIKSSWSQFFAE